MSDKERSPEEEEDGGAPLDEEAEEADHEPEDEAADEGSADEGADESDDAADADEGADAETDSDESDEAPAAAKKPRVTAQEADAALRVAHALGVDDEESAEGESEDEPEAPANRAARRKEEALERRRKRRGSAARAAKPVATAEDPVEDELPKDKNARAKELLRRRREEAAGRREVALAPSEMAEDAFARMTSASGKWFRANFGVIQWFILAGLVGTAGYLFYTSRAEEKIADASDTLAEGVSAERGKVLEEDTRSDEEKELDPSPVFKTSAERSDAAIADYNKVIDGYAGTGAAILAKLGQAGIYLDKKEFDHALEAYSAVAASTLASADADVKGRAIEGQGFAKEGKGDLDAAIATFKELEAVDARGYKELAMYHQARLLMAKGETDKAKELLKAAREKLQTPSIDGQPFQFLEAVVDEALRTIDPSAVPSRQQLGGPKGSSMTPEELEALLKRAREAGEKKAAEHEQEEQGH